MSDSYFYRLYKQKGDGWLDPLDPQPEIAKPKTTISTQHPSFTDVTSTCSYPVNDCDTSGFVKLPTTKKNGIQTKKMHDSVNNIKRKKKK